MQCVPLTLLRCSYGKSAIKNSRVMSSHKAYERRGESEIDFAALILCIAKQLFFRATLSEIIGRWHANNLHFACYHYSACERARACARVCVRAARGCNRVEQKNLLNTHFSSFDNDKPNTTPSVWAASRGTLELVQHRQWVHWRSTPLQAGEPNWARLVQTPWVGPEGPSSDSQTGCICRPSVEGCPAKTRTGVEHFQDELRT